MENPPYSSIVHLVSWRDDVPCQILTCFNPQNPLLPPTKIKYPTKKMEKSEKSQVIIVCLTLFFHSFSSPPTTLGGSGNGPGTRRPPPLDPWSPSVARPRTRVGMEVLAVSGWTTHFLWPFYLKAHMIIWDWWLSTITSWRLIWVNDD